MNSISVGLVIIGRNQADHLKNLAAHLRRCSFDEIIYVDSDSSDDSLQVARDAGWRVAVLSPKGILSAAAGRHLGTLLSKREWIFYLDGDMLPDLETVQRFIEKLPLASVIDCVGFTGNIVDVYPNGAQRTRLQKTENGADAAWLGGSVLLNRAAVLTAGNWNPAVYANEELDLYSRLRHRGGHVVYFNHNLVQHNTIQTPYWKIILAQLGLYDGANPRNGSFGYAIRSTMQDGSFASLARLNPEPFVLSLFTLLTLLVSVTISWPLGLTILSVTFLWVAQRRGLQYILLAYLLIPQAIIGMLKYRDGRIAYVIP